MQCTYLATVCAQFSVGLPGACLHRGLCLPCGSGFCGRSFGYCTLAECGTVARRRVKLPCRWLVMYAGVGVLSSHGAGIFDGQKPKRFLAEGVCNFLSFSGRARVVGFVWHLYL